jgi:N-acetylglucosaminyl-diphospho-decaprenol L-rhamnosyltransferase
MMDAVVVTYNSAKDLNELVQCASCTGAFNRLIVVDNASTDDSVAIARSAGADVIERANNDGMSAAVNEGFRHARSDLVALLNPDVLLEDPTVVTRLAEAFEEDSSLGVAAPALKLPHGLLQDSARTVPTPSQLVHRRLAGSRIGEVVAGTATDVEWVVGAFMVIRRTAFEDVGGFDEGYRLYFEDVDFCVRLWSAGWRVRIDPSLVARHEHQAFSRRSLTSWATRQHVRSAARFYARHPDLLLSTGRERLIRAAH